MTLQLQHQVIAVAEGEVGYHEEGGAHHDGNITKYWTEMYPAGNANHWPWCGCFVSWCCKHGGATLPRIDIPDGFISVYSGANWFASHGLLTHVPAPGLIALYSYGQGHTEIVVSVDVGYTYNIGGNTSPDEGGSQDNGGGVYRRKRSMTDRVIGYGIPPAYNLTSMPVPTPKPQEEEVPYIIHGKGGAYLTDLFSFKRPIHTNANVAAYKAAGVREIEGVFSDDELNLIPGG